MSCERTRELMIDALVETLDTARQQELQDHIEECDACAAEAAAYRKLWRSLDTVALPARRPDCLARLQQAVSDEFGDTASADGPVHPTQWTVLGWPRRIAASIVLIGLGALLAIGVQDYLDGGAGPSATTADDRNRYLLIMTETTEPPEQAEQARAEFQGWIADLLEQGIMEDGLGLADAPPVGTPPDGLLMDETVIGFIIIRAGSHQEARRIAVSSPMIDYGGFIEIHQLGANNDDE